MTFFFRDHNVLEQYKVTLHALNHSIIVPPKLKTFFLLVITVFQPALVHSIVAP